MLLFGLAGGRADNAPDSRWLYSLRIFMGVFKVEHLGLYLAEFDHRWNTRKDSDTERTEKGISKSRGKRLYYKPLVK